MAKTVRTGEPNLPWVSHGEDRGFNVLVGIILVVFFGTGVFLNAIQLPEPERKNLVDVSPRLAKLILEKEKPPPKPPEPKPVPEKKEVEKKPEPEKKKEVEKKPEPKPEPEKKKTAREVAQQTGLIALSDDLADLRESFELDDSLELKQATSAQQEVEVATASDLLSSTAQRSSGGIQTNTLTRTVTTSELAQRKTTNVESKIETDQTRLAKAETGGGGSKKNGAGSRTTAEIERVFQRNKGSIFNLYNRALRTNPGLQGQVVVELTINPDGSVKNVKILSSELGDEKLERKLVLRIKRFKFAQSNVSEITVTYPIDFLPS